MHIISGVYMIRNTVNGKVYIGSTEHGVERRVESHFKQLRKGIHINRHLQHAYRKYGGSSFEWKVVKKCPSNECIRWEQFYIDHYRSSERTHGYNICPIAGSTRGVKYSIAQREACSIAATKAHARPEVRELRKKVRESAEFKKRHAEAVRAVTSDPEYRVKMSESVRTALANPETRKRISEGVLRAYATDPTFVERVREASTGRRHTEESKAKIAAAHARPETKAKLSAALKGRPKSEETKRRMSEAQRNLPPESRKRKSAGAKLGWIKRKANLPKK